LQYKKNISNPGTILKIGVVTDFEYANRKRIGNKLPKRAIPELGKVVEYFNSEFHPDVVVECGDMIESSTTRKIESARSRFQEINKVYSKLQMRREYVLGNHDLRAVNKEQFREFAGMTDNHKYFDLGEWRLVLMDTNFNKEGKDRGPSFYAGGYVSENEFRWLEEAFATKRPIIVFSHHPIVPDKKKNLGNGDEVRIFFEKYDNIILTVSGHDPNFRFNQKNGIAYLVVDNLANKDSIGSFATLKIGYNKYTREAKVNIEHYGPTRETKEIYKKLGDTISFQKYLINLFQSVYSQIFHF
jgi:3',5'-cyclic AMP phosphodiesterase CpdA